METTTTPRRPRVKLRDRLVLVQCVGMGSWHLHKLNKDGSIAGNFKEQVTLADTPQEACKALGIAFAGFEAVNGILGRKFSSAEEQVRTIWKEGSAQLQPR